VARSQKDRSRARERAKPIDAPKSFAGRVWHQTSPIVLAIAIALIVRALVIESFYVPSGSMLPTLLVGDHVFVSKFTYGARIPFTDWRLPSVRDPERGEVAIFELGRGRGGICPLDLCPDARREDFVKRIVGLPGDTLEFRNGRVLINGEPLPLAFDGGQFVDEEDGRSYAVGREVLGEHVHAVLDHPNLPGPQGRRIEVPEGRYFMMGDNRDNSNDSRIWGTVRREEIKGPVVVIYWSWNNRGSWLSMLNPWTWVKLLATETRWSRIGDVLP
jgi:signal peptidase I